METLKQKRLFDDKELKISSSNLFYHDQRIGSRTLDMNIPFEEITNLKVRHNNSEYIYLWISLFCSFMSYFFFISRNDKDTEPFLWIFFGLGSVFSLFYFFVKREKSWKIKLGSGASIFIHRNIPDKETVDNFIEHLFKTKNEYLRETYYRLDRNLSYENQYNNLKWLMKHEIITKDEFEFKYGELKELYNFDKKTIGFGQ